MTRYNLPVEYDNLKPAERRVVREQYIREQAGNCWYCNNPLSGPPVQRVQDKRINLKLFPPNFLKYPVHLQHDHDNGLTEGAVHARCNAVLWQYEGR